MQKINFFKNKTGGLKGSPVPHGSIFTAFHLPAKAHTYLVLHSLVAKQTKSSLFRDLISKWEGERKESHPLDLLIKYASQELSSEWATNVRLQKTQEEPCVSFEEFKKEVERELQALKLPAHHIEKIITGIVPCNL